MTCVLLDIPDDDRRVFVAGDVLEADVLVACYDRETIPDANLAWRLVSDGRTLAEGGGGIGDIAPGAALRNLCVSNGVFTAAEQTGAGIYMEAGLVEDCAITSCGSFPSSKTSGGGIYASGGRIRRTVFTGNKVHMRWSGEAGWGSALYLSHGAVCENSLFTGNAAAPCYDWSAEHRRGGVVHLTGAGTALVNCSVVRNRLADEQGNGTTDYAGIVQKVNAKVVNCVAFGNEPDPGGAYEVTSHWDAYTGGDEWRNNWERFFVQSAWGTANGKDGNAASPIAVAEASFRSYAKGNFAPRTGGVLENAGTTWNDYLGSGAVSETDLEGKPRRVGPRLDIGCYEDDAAVTLIILQ